VEERHRKGRLSSLACFEREREKERKGRVEL